MPVTAASRGSSAPITLRRVSIAYDAADAKDWCAQGKLIERFLNTASLAFPVGEKFFIDSVQAYAGQVTDPVLKEQVRKFIYQEAMHTREHARCNTVVGGANARAEQVERMARRMFAWHRRAPKSFQLACTCALEHLTGILSDVVLRNQDWMIAHADPAFVSLWLWHFAEETEHKAVCFDVYQTVFGKGVGSYLRRTSAMAFVTVVYLLVYCVAGMRQMRKGEDKSTAVQSAEGVPRGFLRLLYTFIPWRLFFEYYRPSFHPWDYDNSAVVERWKANFPALEGTRLDAAA